MVEPISDQWVEFFAAVSAAAGAIFALTFLAVQVREARWRGSPVRTYATLFALSELAAAMFIGLIALLPPHRWWLGAGIIGSAGLVLIVVFVVLFIREKMRDRVPIQRLDWFQVLGTVLISGPVFTFVLFQAFSDGRGLGRLGAACLWLTMSGIVESWALMAASVPAQFERVDIHRHGGPVMRKVKVAITFQVKNRGFSGYPDVYTMRIPKKIAGGPLGVRDVVKQRRGVGEFRVKPAPKKFKRKLSTYLYYTLTKR